MVCTHYEGEIRSWCALDGIKMPDFDLTLAPLHNKYSAVPRVYKIDWPWLSDVSFV